MRKDLSEKIDIDFHIEEGDNSLIWKAKNVMKTQIGSVNYLPEFGCDLEFYIINTNYNIQTQAFKNYLTERLIESNIQVATILKVDELFSTIFNLTLASQEE